MKIFSSSELLDEEFDGGSCQEISVFGATNNGELCFLKKADSFDEARQLVAEHKEEDTTLQHFEAFVEYVILAF